MSQPRLLLIDDEPVLAEFMANAALDSGFEPVVTSEDGEFRDAFLASRPDMVALDLGMPGMDGVELIRFLAEQDYRAPVLIVSGFDGTEVDAVRHAFSSFAESAQLVEDNWIALLLQLHC